MSKATVDGHTIRDAAAWSIQASIGHFRREIERARCRRNTGGGGVNFSKMRCIALALIFSAWIQPALAGKNDDAWAQCLWQNAPTSAGNWLAMPVPKRDYGLVKPPPEYVLQFRLQAACHKVLTPLGKKWPPSFNAKGVHNALGATKPSVIVSDPVDPKAYRCTRYFLNDTERKNPAALEWGFGEGASKHIFTSITYFFAANGGGSVGLPDDGGLKRCEWITESGSLRDA